MAAFGSLIFFERLSEVYEQISIRLTPQAGYIQESSYVFRRFGSISYDTSLEPRRRALINESWNLIQARASWRVMRTRSTTDDRQVTEIARQKWTSELLAFPSLALISLSTLANLPRTNMYQRMKMRAEQWTGRFATVQYSAFYAGGSCGHRTNQQSGSIHWL